MLACLLLFKARTEKQITNALNYANKLHRFSSLLIIGTYLVRNQEGLRGKFDSSC
ncbi:MAG: hypothetical protein OFPI_19040 [Osedax symbiont Rs2]|nr:MAG: hypothetical protein OFPI_19040 [Osedax symbiont Rs2]